MKKTKNKPRTLVVLDKSIILTDHIFPVMGGGTFRAITKCRAGFMSVVDNHNWINIHAVFCGWKKGALQSIEFCPKNSNVYQTVFARKGKKVIIMDKELAKQITVGDINDAQGWYNTNLYNQNQYQAVGAKTWSDKAFVVNTKKSK